MEIIACSSNPSFGRIQTQFLRTFNQAQCESSVSPSGGSEKLGSIAMVSTYLKVEHQKEERSRSMRRSTIYAENDLHYGRTTAILSFDKRGCHNSIDPQSLPTLNIASQMLCPFLPHQLSTPNTYGLTSRLRASAMYHGGATRGRHRNAVECCTFHRTREAVTSTRRIRQPLGLRVRWGREMRQRVRLNTMPHVVKPWAIRRSRGDNDVETTQGADDNGSACFGN
jgi:hypothetical protein